MVLLDSFDFSLGSLTFCFALAFVYFIYQAKYWWRPDILLKADSIFQSVVAVVAVLLIIKLANTGGEEFSYIHLGFLHLGPLALIFLTVQKIGRGGVILSRKRAERSGGDGKGSSYAPVPVRAEVDKIGWEDIIIDHHLRDELQSVIELLKTPKHAENYGIKIPKGMLFEGPPGTGKTSIAKVIANTAGLPLFVLRMDEVVSKWVGESEKNLTLLFDHAARHAPAVIFIDEVDSIGRTRSASGARHSENLLNHLLQLIDGVISTKGLYIIAATNRANLVDPALKRAGRLTKVIEIPLPTYDVRQQLFELYLARLHLEEDVDIAYLATQTEGKSGADIQEICNQAGLNAFQRESDKKKREYTVSNQDLLAALEEFTASGQN